MVTTGMMNVMTLMDTPDFYNMVQNTRNREGTRPSEKNDPKFCKRKEAPIAEMRMVILGESERFVSHFSSSSPTSPVNAGAMMNTSHHGIAV